MSLLTICQDAADAIGLVRPSAIASSNSVEAKQLGVFARLVLRELADRHNWQQLVSEGTITLATDDQDYALASDCLRVVPDTLWDRTNNQIQDFGPGPQEWAFMKGEELTTTQNRRARLLGNLVTFYDAITSADNNDSIKYEYISSNLALNGSTPVAQLTVDTYTARLPEHLVTLGVIARYKASRNMDAAADERRFEREFKRLAGQSTPPKALNLAGFCPKESNLPDRGYGV